MGAEYSVPKKQPTKREADPKQIENKPSDNKSVIQRSTPPSQYNNVKKSKYIENESQSRTQSQSQSMSSESTTTSEDGDEKKEPKLFEKTLKDSRKVDILNPTKPLEGLTQIEKVKKSEEMLRRLWKRPHASWDKITAVTSVTTERSTTDGQVSEEVRQEVDHNVDKIIYDVPLDYCQIKVPRTRTARSCPDPWRRHGAHVKLCEIGGWMPENRNKNAKVTPIRKGSTPPPPPRTKPLQTIDDYVRTMKR